MKRLFTYILLAFLLAHCTESMQRSQKVQIAGNMHNVMWKGNLQGTIALDSLSGKQHLYGVGPLENLSGELLIQDGIVYRSSVITDSTMKVDTVVVAKAPFFVYSQVADWQEHALPDTIHTIPQLELFIDRITKNLTRPFAFKLSGTVESATIHIVNLPPGTIVSSPSEAHRGQINYILKNQACELIGFFSTAHKGVFTHHDSFVHIHLITSDKTKMGHLDKLFIKPGSLKLFLPARH